MFGFARSVGLVAGCLLGLSCLATVAEELAGPRGVVVEEIRNDHAPFLVRVDVDHPNRIYQDGDTMTVTVRSSESGYLYLFYCSADNEISCLFPNQFQQDNAIAKNTDAVVPKAGSNFRIRIAKPFGTEVLKAIVTKQPLKKLATDQLTKGPVTPVEIGQVRGAYVEQLKPSPKEWAEHNITITTIGPNIAIQRPAPRRIGVFIGISEYADSNIRGLKICHVDATDMAAVMKDKCQLDHAIVLLNKQATLKNIEDAIRRQLPQLTRPGDTIFIFWSGHGGRCADDNGDEKDGFDEFLVPHDGDVSTLAKQRTTMLLDDTFGRWIQELDGRKVVLLLDTCHSGGQAENEKGLHDDGVVKAIGGGGFDFFDGEMEHVKDIGQKETALLTSSKATEVSFVMKDKSRSVMSDILIKQLSAAGGKLNLQQVYDNLAKKVPMYVKENFPGATQTPVLIDQTSPPVFVRP